MKLHDYVKQAFSAVSTTPAYNQYVADKGGVPVNMAEAIEYAIDKYDEGYMAGRTEVMEFLKMMDVNITIVGEEPSREGEPE